ncbi:MAG: GAF domain-containing SpoIIE family protein phosphatase [Phycisphaerae bacterium]
MPTLTDYLDPDTLQRLQDAFVAIAQVPICICGADGQPLTKDSPCAMPPPGGPMEHAPIIVREEEVGRILWPAQPSGAAPVEGLRRFGEIFADLIARQARHNEEHASRVQELATLYRLTAEFTTERNVQKVLDLVARTVVDVLKAKASSIRLLNEDRTELVIKAMANLSSQYLDKGKILLSDSQIDQEVISQLKTVYIADERNDPRVLYPASARHEGIVSALCAPMLYKGRAEGVIRVYTGELHAFDWYEVSLLQAIAAQAGAAVVNARLYEEAVNAAGIRRQLHLASEVQRRMIPSKAPTLPGFRIAAMYVPCYELGGDFYDFLSLPEDNLGLAVCDVVGKGVRASLLMASIRASLRAHATNIYQMSEVVARVNRDLCNDTLVSDFATLFYGVIDARAHRLTFANAGHPPPILFRAGQAGTLGVNGPVVGINPAARWDHQVADLRTGDVLLAYTDGLSEALNFDDEPFGRARIEQAALAAIAEGQDADGIARSVLWAMRRFAGLQSRLDDVTMIIVQVL